MSTWPEVMSRIVDPQPVVREQPALEDNDEWCHRCETHRARVGELCPCCTDEQRLRWSR